MEISPGGRIQPNDRLPLVDRITSRRSSQAKMANNGGRRSAVDRRPIAANNGRRRRPRSTDGQDGGRGPGRRRGRMNRGPLTLTLAGGSSNVNSMYRSQRLFGSLDLIYKIKQKRRLDPSPPPPPLFDSQENPLQSTRLTSHPLIRHYLHKRLDCALRHVQQRRPRVRSLVHRGAGVDQEYDDCHRANTP